MILQLLDGVAGGRKGRRGRSVQDPIVVVIEGVDINDILCEAYQPNPVAETCEVAVHVPQVFPGCRH